MTYGKIISLFQLILIITLVLGANISKANPDKISENSGLPTPLYSSMGEPLTDIEIMELHQRRFIDAANNVAKLFNSFDQKCMRLLLQLKPHLHTHLMNEFNSTY